MVLETLNEVDSERRCYRLVGGVLVERTVKDVIPALDHNKEQVSGSALLICKFVQVDQLCNWIGCTSIIKKSMNEHTTIICNVCV